MPSDESDLELPEHTVEQPENTAEPMDDIGDILTDGEPATGVLTTSSEDEL